MQEEMNTNSSENNVAAADVKKHPRPQPEDAVKCPRCDSGNTKFCYYNNYSLSQPRYFCKACRRYWTKGGTLRNVPVGGGCRKKKRSAERHHHQLMVQSQVENNVMSSASAHSKLPLSSFSSPLRFEDSPGTGDSLSLAFARLQKQCNNGHLGLDQFDLHHQPAHPVFGNPVTNLGFLSNLYETQTTSFDSQSMYNYGFGNGGAQDHHQSHTQPMLPSEDLSLSNLSAAPTTEVFSLMSGSVKQEMCGNVGMNDSRMLYGFPWQMSNNGVPSSSTENLLLGSNNNSYNYNNGRESWNSTGLAAAQSWPNLINSTALM